MRPDELLRSRKENWDALDALVRRCQSGEQRLSPEEIERMGWLYRTVTSDLALAQRDFPRHALAQYLNQLTARAQATIYRSEPLGMQRLWRFAWYGFPQAVRLAWKFVLAAAGLLFIPAILAAGLTAWQPALAQWVLPPEVQDRVTMIENQDLWTDIPVAERPYASSFIMQNNIRVTFLAFGGGMLAGLLTVWIMIFNGLLLGGITGLTIHYGIGFELWTFVIGHGVVELSVICIAGGAGLQLGWAMIFPGLMQRGAAIALAAQRAVRLLIGSVPLLVLAGLIEGFISPAEYIHWAFKWGLGLASGALLYAYLGGYLQRGFGWLTGRLQQRAGF